MVSVRVRVKVRVISLLWRSGWSSDCSSVLGAASAPPPSEESDEAVRALMVEQRYRKARTWLGLG